MTAPLDQARPVIDFTASNGVPFRVALDISASGVTTVRFYDRRHTHTPDGQFVSDYYVDTIVDTSSGGVNLCGHVSEWWIDTDSLGLVRSWLRANLRAVTLLPAVQYGTVTVGTSDRLLDPENGHSA